MSPIIYNSSVGVGVVLTSVGAGAQFGWPVGLIVAGAMLIGLSVYTLRVLVR